MEPGKYKMYFDGGRRVVGLAIYGVNREVDVFYSREADIMKLENRNGGDGIVTIVGVNNSDFVAKMTSMDRIRKEILSRRHPVKDVDFQKFREAIA